MYATVLMSKPAWGNTTWGGATLETWEFQRHTPEIKLNFPLSCSQAADKLLELFCRTDQMCVCMLCTVSDHKTHDVVPLKEEYEEKKAELEKTEAEIQQMIKKRRLKIQEIKDSVKLSKNDADREIAEGVQVFTSLKVTVERSQAELIRTIEENQKKTPWKNDNFKTCCTRRHCVNYKKRCVQHIPNYLVILVHSAVKYK